MPVSKTYLERTPDNQPGAALAMVRNSEQNFFLARSASGLQTTAPIPPFSPKIQMRPPHLHYPLRSTVNLLDSLVASYQQKRMWVYRTRASLEEVSQDSPSTSESTTGGNTTFTFPSQTSPVPRMEPDSLMVKQEPPSNSPRTSPMQPHTRWLRRKKGFKLKLKRIGPRGGERSSSLRQGTQRHYGGREGQDSQPHIRILELFENMMEARMESCQRVNKLVKRANRADLHIR